MIKMLQQHVADNLKHINNVMYLNNLNIFQIVYNSFNVAYNNTNYLKIFLINMLLSTYFLSLLNVATTFGFRISYI